MKAIPKTICIVAAGNFLFFWVMYGLLAASAHTSIWQFLGLAPSPSPSSWFSFLVWTFGILGAPMSIALDGASSEHFMIRLVLLSILTAAIWGGCLGFLLMHLPGDFAVPSKKLEPIRPKTYIARVR